MTDPSRTEQERAFGDAVLKQIGQGRFGRGVRRKLMDQFGADRLLSPDESGLFHRLGKLPPRFFPVRPSQPADPADYEMLAPQPRDFRLALTPPVQHDDGPLPISRFARKEVRKFPTEYVLRAEGVTAYIKNHLSLYEVSSGYIPEITDGDPMVDMAELNGVEQRKLSGKTANLVVTGSAMFSHWTFDVLPRVKLLRDRGFSISDFDHVLIATRNPRFTFHDQGLAALGVDPAQVQAVKDGGPSFAFDTLITPSAIRAGYYAEPWVYEEVRRLFMPHSGGSTTGKRLFIGRKGDNKRAVVNMDALQPVLDAFGFETVYAEDHTISEFAQVMNGAAVVTGPHGAGFSNIVFCKPGTRVLELYGAHITDEFWGICNTMGMEHHILAGYDAEGRRPWQEGAFPVVTQKERNAAPFSVDPDDLRRTFQAIC
jgi:hypothetical protein